MKRKDDFLIKKVGERSFLFLKEKEDAPEADGTMFAMNETGRFVWDLLETEQTEYGIIVTVLREYFADSQDDPALVGMVEADIRALLKQMSEAGAIEA